MSIESLDKSEISRWSLEVSNTMMCPVVRTRLRNLQHENRKYEHVCALYRYYRHIYIYIYIYMCIYPCRDEEERLRIEL